jgi:hypothetical protein
MIMTDREILELLLKQFGQFNTRMETMEKGQTTMQENIEHVRQNQAKMEYELTEKFSAISEAQKVTDEKLEILSNNTKQNFEFVVNTLDYVATKIDHVAADTAMLVSRVTRLETSK